jgi:hypothetical protein
MNINCKVQGMGDKIVERNHVTKAKSLMETKRHTKTETLKKVKSLMETGDMENGDR